MARVLLVEDDEFLLDALKALLECEGHKVTPASNGKQACLALDSASMDCIISDLQMPEMGGIELARWVKGNKPTPLIMMTGYAGDVNVEKALAEGAKDILFKPFSLPQIVNAVDRCLGREENSGARPSGLDLSRFVSVSVSLLAHEISSDFDYYQLENGAMRKIVSRGELLKAGWHEDLKRAGVHYLFAERESLERLIPVNLKLSRAAAKTSSVSPERKAALIKGAGELLYGKFRLKGLDEESFKQSVEVVQTFLDVISDSQLTQVIETFRDTADQIYANALGVSTYGVMVGRELGWTATENMKILVAGLFHDLGKLGLPENILRTPRTLMTVAERTQFESHVERGATKLRRSNLFTEEIVRVVAEHHEDCVGRGYPHRLSKDKIHPLARLIFVLDHFCNAVIGTSGRGMPVENALKQMETLPGVDSYFYLSLRNLFQLKIK